MRSMPFRSLARSLSFSRPFLSFFLAFISFFLSRVHFYCFILVLRVFSFACVVAPTQRKPDARVEISLFFLPLLRGTSGGLMQQPTIKVEARKLWIPIYVKKLLYSCSMRRLQERLLGSRWTSAAASGGDIWLLGICHKVSDSEDDSGVSPSFSEFLLDFESRIWITYRQGFEAIENSKLTTDAGWGCMIRSGQMLLAQALVCYNLGRAWRRKTNQPYPQEYFEILQYFGDSPTKECSLSIHNLLDVGKPFGLAPGAWLGPYALCRTVESLAKADISPGQKFEQRQVLPMVVYVAAGDAEGERGGAPVLCKDDVMRTCTEREDDSSEWAPLLILIPLVLGPDKINPRYLPALRATFCFPQSLGIMGGKPGASTYLVGVQDDQVLYLDPHEVQQYVKIAPADTEVDTSSYHCSVVRRMPLNAIDPSLALGFYCHKREDFSDLCIRASELAEQIDGAPIFTVAEECRREKRNLCTNLFDENVTWPSDIDCHSVSMLEAASTEDEWQIL